MVTNAATAAAKAQGIRVFAVIHFEAAKEADNIAYLKEELLSAQDAQRRARNPASHQWRVDSLTADLLDYTALFAPSEAPVP